MTTPGEKEKVTETTMKVTGPTKGVTPTVTDEDSSHTGKVPDTMNISSLSLSAFAISLGAIIQQFLHFL